MELASVMRELSFRKNPRDGQKAVLEAVIAGGNHLNIQLPTGYGKTFTACAAYSILRHFGRVNRLLYITPTVGQHEQFVCGAHEDLRDCGVPVPHKIKDVSYFQASAIKDHRNNQCQVFAITVQSLITKDGMDRVEALLQQGQWMIVVDEYHHYGIEAAWGRSVLALNCAYRLSMSATPHRPNDDGAFGKPDVVVTYRKAVDEGAVKPLVGHSYTYRIDAITGDGQPVSYTTSELKEEFGEGDTLELKMIERKMRWSPKYVSPLVSVPIERMINSQLKTGIRLQAIIGAMCVSHAKMVCEQVRAMFPELSVDWVGTGQDGRSPEENRGVLARFCPPKDESGVRRHSLDILVHVGMAGEGLDSVSVSEVIHLNPANINNSNNQENGRAARYLDGVLGHINFDSSSEYAKKGYIGSAVMDAMDCVAPLTDMVEPDAGADDSDVTDIPEEPMIVLADMELIHIDSGSPEVRRVQRLIVENPQVFRLGITRENVDSEESVLIAINMYRNMRRKEAEEFNEKAVVEQWKDSVNKALGQIVATVIRMTHAKNATVPKSLAGDLKKRLNGMKAKACGPISDDVEVCRNHYTWIYNLQESIKRDGVPTWLA